MYDNEAIRLVLQNEEVSPQDPVPGMIYYDVDRKLPKVWNGSAWVELIAGKLPFYVVGSSTWTGYADVYCSGTDDQITINNAINYVSSNYGTGVVLLTPGTFSVSDSIQTIGNVYLIGSGRGSTIITQPDGAGVSSIITSSDGKPTWVKDLTINGNNTNNSGSNVNGVNSQYISIHNVEVTDTYINTANNVVRSSVDSTIQVYGRVDNSSIGGTLSLTYSNSPYVTNTQIGSLGSGSKTSYITNCRITSQVLSGGTIYISNSYIAKLPTSFVNTKMYIDNSYIASMKSDPNYPFNGQITNSIIVPSGSIYVGGGLQTARSRVANSWFNGTALIYVSNSEVVNCHINRGNVVLTKSTFVGNTINAGYFSIDQIGVSPTRSNVSNNVFNQSVLIYPLGSSSPQNMLSSFSNNYVYSYLEVRLANRLTISGNKINDDQHLPGVYFNGSSFNRFEGNHQYYDINVGAYNGYNSTHNIFVGNTITIGVNGYLEGDANQDYNIITNNIFYSLTGSPGYYGANDVVANNITG